MVQQNVPHESHLQKLIRKIVREELSQFLIEVKKKKDSSSPPSEPETSKNEPNFTPPRMAEDLHTGTWAIFGTPELDPVYSQANNQPRALPGFPELYRPDFTGFDAPPFIPKHPKGKRPAEESGKCSGENR
ncbi:MAG: hypothetical protein WB502_10440 [Thermoactinomyces sp.]